MHKKSLWGFLCKFTFFEHLQYLFLKASLSCNAVPVTAKPERKHPLALMVEGRCEELLNHELTRQLLDHKWKCFVSPVFFIFLFFYTAYLICFTVYITTARPPYFRNKTDFCLIENAETSVMNDGVSKRASLALAILTTVFWAINIAKEVI